MKLQILLVDDDPDDIAIIQDYFEDASFEHVIEACHSGEQMLARLKEGAAPDLVLLDLNMPGMGGMDALQRIRADPKLADQPVIVLTTSNQEQDIEASFDAKANYFVTKPDSAKGFDSLVQLVGAYADAYIWPKRDS